jgi:hypothetical protein
MMIQPPLETELSIKSGAHVSFLLHHPSNLIHPSTTPTASGIHIYALALGNLSAGPFPPFFLRGTSASHYSLPGGATPSSPVAVRSSGPSVHSFLARRDSPSTTGFGAMPRIPAIWRGGGARHRKRDARGVWRG